MCEESLLPLVWEAFEERREILPSAELMRNGLRRSRLTVGSFSLHMRLLQIETTVQQKAFPPFQRTVRPALKSKGGTEKQGDTAESGTGASRFPPSDFLHPPAVTGREAAHAEVLQNSLR